MLLHTTIFHIVKWLAISLAGLFLFVFGLPFILRFIGVDIDFGRGGTNGGADVLLRSADGGRTWQNAGIAEAHAQFPRVLFALSFHPEKKQTLFLGAQSSGLWRSDTGGVSWKNVSDPTGVLDPRAYAHALAQSVSRPDVMYVGAFQNKRGRVLKSRDGGIRFEEVYAVSEDQFGVLDIEVDPKDSDHLFIATGEGGLLESRDGGESWRVIRWFGEAIRAIVGNPAVSDTFFVHAASGKLWKTTDKGVQWREAGSDVRDFQGQEIQIVVPSDFSPFSFSGGKEVSLIAESSKVPQDMVAVVDNMLFQSRDRGDSWKEVALPISSDSEEITSLEFHPESSQIIFAGVGSRLLRSHDGGASWQTTTLPTEKKISHIFIHPGEERIMFVVLE